MLWPSAAQLREGAMSGTSGDGSILGSSWNNYLSGSKGLRYSSFSPPFAKKHPLCLTNQGVLKILAPHFLDLPSKRRRRRLNPIKA
jgi:hypothetical protein